MMDATRDCPTSRVSVASETVSGRLEVVIVFSHGGGEGDTDTCLGKSRVGESHNCGKTTYCMYSETKLKTMFIRQL